MSMSCDQFNQRLVLYSQFDLFELLLLLLIELCWPEDVKLSNNSQEVKLFFFPAFLSC